MNFTNDNENSTIRHSVLKGSIVLPTLFLRGRSTTYSIIEKFNIIHSFLKGVEAVIHTPLKLLASTDLYYCYSPLYIPLLKIICY